QIQARFFREIRRANQASIGFVCPAMNGTDDSSAGFAQIPSRKLWIRDVARPASKHKGLAMPAYVRNEGNTVRITKESTPRFLLNQSAPVPGIGNHFLVSDVY